jgi:hypothetical protein
LYDAEMKLHIKYPMEGRFSFGVAAIELFYGRIEGRAAEKLLTAPPRRLSPSRRKRK